MLDVVVYGATGYTGRLVAAELARQNVAFAVAGRDAGKLDALVRALGRPVEAISAPLDDAAALERMAARARVVLDCAGPFARWGKPVQDAALAAGRHFLDVTGEAGYMRDTAQRDAEARARNIALVNAVGFDVVPTDAAAVLAAEAAGTPPERVWIAFGNRGAGPSQGTSRSMLDGARFGGAAFVDGKLRPEPVGARRWEAPLPEPLGRRSCISIPWGDLATAPRSTGAREVRTFIAVGRATARWAQALAPAARLLGLAPLRALGERYIRRLPEGPSDEQRAHSNFGVYAEATGSQGTRGVWVAGGNGYDFTARSAVLCARLAARPEFAARGALTPSQAFGARALLDGLGDAIRWGMAE
jgi:saccharopine dehydrogenase (NAD+, L-lysine-forming)